jgi:16S rRNA (cytosine967-C5)-methyltransferase
MRVGDERDRNLATTLVYGVLRRRTTLDRLIESTSKRPLTEIDLPTLLVLRIALFQILFLTRVPRAAAVDEAVSLLRARRGRGAAAFANGVLRSACRLLESGPAPRAGPPGEPAAPAVALAETHSFPVFMVERYLERLGRDECESLLEALNRPAAVVLRLTRRAADGARVPERLAEEGVETIPSPFLPGALRVLRGAPQRTRAFREGLVYVQDEAAQIVALLSAPIDPPAGLLDLCAAPGGKLLAAAETLAAGTLVVAADASAGRLRLLRDNARRLGIEGILDVAMDAALPALRREFGCVLLDAPCTGTGVIRRHPEIRWRRAPEDVGASAVQQAKMLLAAAGLVSRAGRLVYSVCSLEPEEGPERVEAFLRERADFATVDARTILPPALHPLVDGRGFLQTRPHKDDMDGFFAAVLSRS